MQCMEEQPPVHHTHMCLTPEALHDLERRMDGPIGTQQRLNITDVLQEGEGQYT